MSISSMYVDEARFKIKFEYFPLVLEAMKRVKADVPVTGTWTHMIKQSFLRNLGFNCVFDKETLDLVDTWYTCDGINPNHKKYFQVIAKYVEAGSFINCRGDEWTFWQWYFNGDCMIEKTGRVVFE